MIEITILTKVISREFYRTNAGFFLVMIAVCFGFLRDVEHIALAEFFISTWWSVYLPVVTWLIYSLKIVFFNKNILQKPENEFLFSLRLLPTTGMTAGLLATVIVQLAPIVAYASFLVMVSLSHHLFLPALIFSGAIVVIVSGCVIILGRDIHRRKMEPRSLWIKQWFDRKFNRTYVMMAIEWLGRKEPLTFAGTKVLSYLLLYAVLQLYQSDNYDIRLMAIGSCIAFSMNVIIIYHIQVFENSELALYRNLPLSFFKRLTNFIGTMFVVCLPETGLLVAGMIPHFSLTQLGLTLWAGWSVVILFYGIQYIRDWSMEPLLRRCFFLMLLFFVVILFKLPIVVLAAGNVIIGLILARRYYYTFEYLK